MENDKVWTTENDNNGNETNLSRVSTAEANRKPKQNHNPALIGVQSRFRRKYFHKTIFLILGFIIVILLIAIVIMAIYYRYFERTCESSDCLRAAANLLQSMDRSVSPCDDFYKFTCGNWAEDHPRPDSAASYDWFHEKQNKVLRTIRSFLQANETDDEPNAVKQSKILYKGCMDTASMDALGLQPIVDYLLKFHLPSTPTYLNLTENFNYNNYTFDWILSIASIKRIFGGDLVIGFDITLDPTNRTRNRLALGRPESDTLLPLKNDYEKLVRKAERKYLTEDDLDNETDSVAVKAYTTYVTEVLSAMVFYTNPTIDLTATLPQLQETAKTAVRITKAIYKLVAEAENMTDSVNVDPFDGLLLDITVAELQNRTNHLLGPKKLIIWERYLTILFSGIPEAKLNLREDIIITTQPDLAYLDLLTQFIQKTPTIELELYVWWSLVDELALHTTTDIRKLHNEYARQITNLEGGQTRSLYCTGGVNGLMGMAVSYAIAKPDFLNITRPKVLTMLNNIREAFNNLVRQTNWMDFGTKRVTLEKSMSMRSLIGFPEFILEKGKLDEFYAEVQFNETTHLLNMMNMLQWEMYKRLKNFRVIEPFGWATTPTNVNAFHTFQENAITVPLAILQYPFYNLGLEALNYGAIGTILGHELTHGFDDSGRRFDKDGNMIQWWTNDTIKEYINRTTCFINQYSGYYLPEISEYIDGELTLGENIADNGGLREAFYAYKLYVKKFGRENLLPGFEDYSHEQLFFISFGNLWCETPTPTATRWALEDSHCPGKIRLKGVLSNSPEFSTTFGCNVGDGMYPKERCRIW